MSNRQKKNCTIPIISSRCSTTTSMAEQLIPIQEVKSLSIDETPKSGMTLEERLKFIRSIGEECIGEDELRNLLANKDEPICFDAFQPSGRMHIALGVMKMINVNKLTSAGCRVKMMIADLPAFLNNKMGGDPKKIEIVGKYFIEIWKSLGMDSLGKVEFLWSSEEIYSHVNEYWPLVLDIARTNKLPRLTNCCQVEQDEISGAQIMCPCMQCADIFFLKADICQQGMDQREVNILAREYCDGTEGKNKPIILSHHMLPGLQQGQGKMSNSEVSSAIFMDDDQAEVNVKIKKAYCPPKVVEGNPCLEYLKYIVFPWFKEFSVERKAEFGGAKTYNNYEELVVDYEREALHPGDVKPALSKALNKILQPVRDHFANDSNAKELLKKVKTFSRTTSTKVDKKKTKEQQTPADNKKPLAVNDTPQSSSEVALEERFQIIRTVGEECIQEDELRNLLAHKDEPICYDGFEPSGRMHIAQGVMKTINVNRLTSAGCKVRVWIADWFAFLNNKMGGDLEKIEVVGNYFIEIWKASGMDLSRGKVELLWSSEEINSRSREYWPIVMDIARKNKLPRLTRCCQIMGRTEQDELSGAQILYPCMQCADIFFLKADICQLGMDQRKVNVLAREYCDDIKRKNKPIILSHHMLPGLQQGQTKMSKSDASSAIFMEDEADVVNHKIEMAYCPPKVVDGNPCLEYLKYIVFPKLKEFTVVSSAEDGRAKTYQTYEDFVVDYEAEALRPDDVKPALSKALNIILQPVRDHFSSGAPRDLLERVKSYRVTR
ncbi:tyrosine--tRNA ligase 2, cytoplasmic-like [Silene latifolia]|uniref:tyrosine--tRNA ligase 2, cytoplasmic-like n=1 Tax=Silene latifolia TaxID=37657 RepID=UPI003D78AEBF